MKKNIVIIPCGDNSLHTEWLCDDSNFDIGIIYYGNDNEKYKDYSNNATFTLKEKGEKWFLISKFLEEFKDDLINYDYFWFPDDDLKSDCTSINKLFNLNKEYNLWLSQPALDGYVSHIIERRVEIFILRFTNFVEIICPMMNYETLNKLKNTFTINQSAWGLDFLWPKLLGYPSNKIAIIDDVVVTHTKPVGTDYSRFKINPMDDLKNLMNKYKLNFSQKNIGFIKK